MGFIGLRLGEMGPTGLEPMTSDLLRVKQAQTANTIGSHGLEPISHPVIPAHSAKIVRKLFASIASGRTTHYQCARSRAVGFGPAECILRGVSATRSFEAVRNEA